MQTLNPNVYPKGGHYYKESDGTKLVGQTWSGVVSRVANYRKRAGLPPGNPQQEVIDQACARDPGLCRNDNGVRAEQTKRASLKSRVLQWLALAKAHNESPCVPDEVARARASICAGCPLNTEIGQGCGSCKQALGEARKEILGRTRQDSRLHGCAETGEDNCVAVWLERPTIDSAALPGYCWRKRTI